MATGKLKSARVPTPFSKIEDGRVRPAETEDGRPAISNTRPTALVHTHTGLEGEGVNCLRTKGLNANPSLLPWQLLREPPEVLAAKVLPRPDPGWTPLKGLGAGA
jgi:hypothetical protein